MALSESPSQWDELPDELLLQILSCKLPAPPHCPSSNGIYLAVQANNSLGPALLHVPAPCTIRVTSK